MTSNSVQLDKLSTLSIQLRNLPTTSSELTLLTSLELLTSSFESIHNEILNLTPELQSSNNDSLPFSDLIAKDPQSYSSLIAKNIVLEVFDMKRGIRRMNDLDVNIWRGRGLFGDKESQIINAIYLLYKDQCKYLGRKSKNE